MTKVRNKEKVRIYNALYAKTHPEKMREKSRLYAQRHPEYNKRSCKERRDANIEVARKRARDWKKANPDKVNAIARAYIKAKPYKKNANTAHRRATKLNATPLWRNEFYIKEAYHLAKLRSKATKIEHQVDHIVPLRSKLVCGLHNEFNLRVIPKLQNITKGNKIWPNQNWTKGGNECYIY
jgi:hypothetical protein